MNRSLKHVAETFANGERNAEKLIAQVREEITQEPMAVIDYVEIYALPELQDAGNELHGKESAGCSCKIWYYSFN